MHPEHASTLLSIRNAGRMSRDGKQWLFRNWSLQLDAGDQLGLLGESGGGKSLLLRSLAALDRLDEGDLHWCGRPLAAGDIPHYRSQVIYIAQRPFLFEGSVEDNLKRPFALQVHAGRKFDRVRIVEWLSKLNRDPTFLVKSHHDLSGGEAQIVTLLRAMQLDPRVLLLDESLSGLDALLGQAMEQIIHAWMNIAQDKRAVIWVSHQNEQIARNTSRRVQIRNGQLWEE